MKKISFNANSFLLSLFVLIFSQITSSKTVIHAGQLIDGNNPSPLQNMSIIISGEKIISIEQGFIEPDIEDIYIDLGSYTVLPGLIDMHVHLDGEHNKNSSNEKYILTEADNAINSVVNAQKTLLAGFTTVRNLGDSDLVTISLRNAINKGILPGPRIYTSGSTISSTGGHGDQSNGARKNLKKNLRKSNAVVNSPSDAFLAVRSRYQEGADLIKITATGGVLSVAKNGENPQFTKEELKAIITSSKDYGFKVAAHAHGAEGIKRAVIAGVNSIEHGTLMDEEGRKLMIQNGTYLVPTIMAGKWVEEKSKEENYFPEIVRLKAAKIGPLIQASFGKAYQSGVKIAFGTDSGVSLHGENAKEFVLMVEAGMPPLQAILSATKEASILLGQDKLLGTLQEGKYADIVAVSTNPIDDISSLQSIDFVMKAGEVYKTP
ncbi:MAG: amidohydrolase family protein [SAR86 cluster bacterium]|nr:amidohydrolase family protein [SAR86 cluster bacterium]